MTVRPARCAAPSCQGLPAGGLEGATGHQLGEAGQGLIAARVQSRTAVAVVHDDDVVPAILNRPPA